MDLEIVYQKLYKAIWDPKISTNYRSLVDELRLTAEGKLFDCKYEHPLLHELAHQHNRRITDPNVGLMFIAIANHPIYKDMWDSLEYIDTYGHTFLQRFSINIYHDDLPETLNWIATNFKVKRIDSQCPQDYGQYYDIRPEYYLLKQ